MPRGIAPISLIERFAFEFYRPGDYDRASIITSAIGDVITR